MPEVLAEPAASLLAPESLLETLFAANAKRVLSVDASHVEITCAAPGTVRDVRIADPRSGASLQLEPRHVVLAAGRGNAELRRRCGLVQTAMQSRPLHMVLVRGNLPELNGHCLDGAKTRVTITSDTDDEGRMVWQIGGQIAEEGVNLD